LELIEITLKVTTEQLLQIATLLSDKSYPLSNAVAPERNVEVPTSSKQSLDDKVPAKDIKVSEEAPTTKVTTVKKGGKKGVAMPLFGRTVEQAKEYQESEAERIQEVDKKESVKTAKAEEKAAVETVKAKEVAEILSEAAEATTITRPVVTPPWNL